MEEETPLDVLSRAASMVETDEANRESFYKQQQALDARESPSKELPTKLLKHERVKDRQDLSQKLNFSRDHMLKLNNKRCTGTQTQISSFGKEHYLNGEHLSENFMVQRTMMTQSSRSPPQVPSPDMVDADSENVPLNLSLTNTTQPQQQLRPSVITCASSVVSASRYSTSSSFVQNSPSRREVTSVGVCDPAIEEHFRRSLGKDYQKYTLPKSRMPAAEPGADSVTASVDDHFAKSLGNSTWSAIKARRESIPLDLFAESVDDHFAKALGDTWLRIKAEKETNCCNSPPSSPQQHTSVVLT